VLVITTQVIAYLELIADGIGAEGEGDLEDARSTDYRTAITWPWLVNAELWYIGNCIIIGASKSNAVLKDSTFRSSSVWISYDMKVSWIPSRTIHVDSTIGS
jgi:hypothetical protein